MENYLSAEDVAEGKVVKVLRNSKFEGYASLIEKDGPKYSMLEGEHGPLLIKQRWLIQWTCPDDLDITLTKEERITQSILNGKRCHRDIVYCIKEAFGHELYSRSRYETLDVENKLSDDFDGAY